MRNSFQKLSLMLAGFLVFASSAYADPIKNYTPNPEAIEKGMTLWQLMVAGGSVMIFIGLLSVIGVALIIYHFIYIRASLLTPQDFSETLLDLMQKGDFEKAEN